MDGGQAVGLHNFIRQQPATAAQRAVAAGDNAVEQQECGARNDHVSREFT